VTVVGVTAALSKLAESRSTLTEQLGDIADLSNM